MAAESPEKHIPSMEMEPWNESAVKAFLRAQLFTKAKHLPPSTDLTGQVAIVTGANIGLGLEACKQFLSFGVSTLIVAVRSQAKGDATAETLRKIARPGTDIQAWLLDLDSYDSIRAFAARCASSLKRIDIAVMGAGLFSQGYTKNASTGHETTLQVNYLSTMLLTVLLLDVMVNLRKQHPQPESLARKPWNLTVVSSGMALTAKLPHADASPFLPTYDPAETYNMEEAYAAVKLLQMMFVARLATLVDPDPKTGHGVVLNVIDPGMARTDLHRKTKGAAKIAMRIMWLIARSQQDAASTYLDAAVAKGVESHGCFVMDWAVRPFPPIMYQDNIRALAGRLWEETLNEPGFEAARQIVEGLSQTKITGK